MSGLFLIQLFVGVKMDIVESESKVFLRHLISEYGVVLVRP
jgi:hypothetical protein